MEKTAKEFGFTNHSELLGSFLHTPGGARHLASFGHGRPRRGVALMPVAVAGAASTAVRQALTGPARPARVLAVFPAAVYLEIADAAEPRVIALVTSDAMRPPNAVAIAATASGRPFATVRDDHPASIGGSPARPGGLRLGALRVE